MDYRQLFNEENNSVRERYELSMERILLMKEENSVKEPYRDYFVRTAAFVETMGELAEAVLNGSLDQGSIETLKSLNQRAYEDILGTAYEISYANPAYAAKMLGSEFGNLLSFLYAELRLNIIFAHECRLTEMTILNEVFIEIYNLFEDGTPKGETVKEVLYWFVSDYCDLTVDYRLRETLDSSLSFARDVVMNSDLSDLSYLYRYGEYISNLELDLAAYMNSLPEEKIRLMADTYTEGFRRGFESTGRELSRKNTVMIRYSLGLERMVRYAVENFRKLGLEPIIPRAAGWVINRNPNRRVGYFGTSPNRQYDYDHRFDLAICLNKALKDRKMAVLRVAYEKYKKEAAVYAGPSLIETFGQTEFNPVNKSENWSYTEKQEKISLEMANESSRIMNEFIPDGETSFTIIAFPVPEIGPDFCEIFDETIRINTLDYEKYQKIQQNIISALDQASYVTIKGKGENTTDLKVALSPLNNPEKETNFENCVADVNIPVGEVFTSPQLKGTEGRLFVSSVYIGDIQFKNMYMQFKDGRVTDYGCSNFPDQAEGKKLIKEQILKSHESLPMGEFAIGTNTTAYAMAQKFGILNKLPILIVEKMGPHFAVGDTCYNWSEENRIYNPDGKEVVAKDNEVSCLRKEDTSKAYFSCHTDITIPYRELDSITAVRADGTKISIIRDGVFSLAGTEELNIPLQ